GHALSDQGRIHREQMMARRVPLSFRARTAATAVIALAVWAVLAIAVPLVPFPADARLFGLPLGAALVVPVGLPALALAMLWFAARQTSDAERFGDDDWPRPPVAAARHRRRGEPRTAARRGRAGRLRRDAGNAALRRGDAGRGRGDRDDPGMAG